MSMLREATPSQHQCTLPRNEFRRADTGERWDGPIVNVPRALLGPDAPEPAPIPDVYLWPGVGAVWQCDGCGKVWVSYWSPGYDGPRVSVCGSVKWRPEKRRERNRRWRERAAGTT